MKAALATMFGAALTLACCSFETAEEFARALWPELEFEEVLASKRLHSGGHGCTYVVLRLTDTPVQQPPVVEPLYMPDTFSRSGGWQQTPYGSATSKHELPYCLVGSHDKIDGAGLEGFGVLFVSVLEQEGAWWLSYGNNVDTVVMIYAPDARLALHARLGD